MADSSSAQSAKQDLAGLDFDFLRYMGVRSETQRQIQEFYLPHFASRENVIDLGCGDGDFVRMLMERGVQVTGVDSDAKALAAAQQAGLPVVQEDVFQYLKKVPAASVDGIFCAHLVEHVAYDQVIELVRLSFAALAPGGVLILATPDVRSLYSHLEMFYLHFGHISFYHPRLLCFFMDHAGFTGTQYGTNPRTASPMLCETRSLAENTDHDQVHFPREIPSQGNSLVHRLSYSLKRRLARWLVLPFLDEMANSINLEIDLTRKDLQNLAVSIQSLNGPFECYALAHKPPLSIAAPATATAPK